MARTKYYHRGRKLGYTEREALDYEAMKMLDEFNGITTHGPNNTPSDEWFRLQRKVDRALRWLGGGLAVVGGIWLVRLLLASPPTDPTPPPGA